jgi:hypothetical protein
MYRLDILSGLQAKKDVKDLAGLDHRRRSLDVRERKVAAGQEIDPVRGVLVRRAARRASRRAILVRQGTCYSSL